MSFLKSVFRNQTIKKYLFEHGNYLKYGLLRDDVLADTPEVIEALRRLPQSVKDERVYRIQRACQLSLTHTILPKEEWTKFEEDTRYLQPYVNEVEAEIREKQEWAALHS